MLRYQKARLSCWINSTSNRDFRQTTATHKIITHEPLGHPNGSQQSNKMTLTPFRTSSSPQDLQTTATPTLETSKLLTSPKTESIVKKHDINSLSVINPTLFHLIIRSIKQRNHLTKTETFDIPKRRQAVKTMTLSPLWRSSKTHYTSIPSYNPLPLASK